MIIIGSKRKKLENILKKNISVGRFRLLFPTLNIETNDSLELLSLSVALFFC